MTWTARLPLLIRPADWRVAARNALSHGLAPGTIDWTGEGGLFASGPLPETAGPKTIRVSKAFLDLAARVLPHRDAKKFDLLYQALWRLDRSEGNPMLQTDPLGRQLQLMAKSVGRDIHKMHAFVRFRELPPVSNRRNFAAWFEPEHFTLEPGSSFFAKRFADMDWMIATPDQTATFRNGSVTFGPGSARPDLPEDASEALWATYFANIFNPARIKLKAMQSEMPKKYWKNMPETALIPDMLADAEARVARMHAAGASQPRAGAALISTRYRATLPVAPEMPETLDEAQQAALHCRRCGLCEHASRTIWGEGDPQARLMIVGEQPGDQEDLTGRVFVGPAGQLLREAMAGAGVQPETLWLTNAVKHFKFAPRGKQRLHQNPNRGEIEACRWWLGLELAFVKPQLVLAMGRSAAFALTGQDAPLTGRRGQIETGLHEGPVLLTWHPSAILRQPDPVRAAQMRAELSADLARAQAMADQPPIS